MDAHQEDLLLVARRRGISTLIRALLFPIVLALVLSFLKVLDHDRKALECRIACRIEVTA